MALQLISIWRFVSASRLQLLIHAQFRLIFNLNSRRNFCIVPNVVQLANYNDRFNKDTEALNKLPPDEFLWNFLGNYIAGITIAKGKNLG